MNDKDPEARLLKKNDAQPDITLKRTNVNDVEVNVIRPEADTSASGNARRRVDEERKRGAGIIGPGYKDPSVDMMDPTTSRVVDAVVGAAFAIGFAACVSFGAPLALTGFVLGTGVMAIYDIVQHRMRGDDSSIISRPGSMVKAVITGVGVASTVTYGIVGAAATVAASAAAEVVLDDDGTASDVVDRIVESVADMSTWLWAALMAFGAYIVHKYVGESEHRTSFRSLLGRNYRRI